MNRSDIAPCGIDCINCELHQSSTRTDIQQMVAASMNKTVEEIKCKGCLDQNGCVIHEDCKTLECVKTKGVDYCYECSDFPCNYLMPAQDMADRLPHNMKVYNLCRIKQLGPEKFLQEALENRKRYFAGKMVIGSGPQI